MTTGVRRVNCSVWLLLVLCSQSYAAPTLIHESGGCPVRLLPVIGQPFKADYCFREYNWKIPGFDVYQAHQAVPPDSVPKDWTGSDLVGYVAVSRRGSCIREFDIASLKLGKRLAGVCV